jgi:hypothetical protein
LSAILAHAHEACGECLIRAHDSDSTVWMLFRVRGYFQAEYAAVRRETGEVRFLGLLGIERAALAHTRRLLTPTVALLPGAEDGCSILLPPDSSLGRWFDFQPGPLQEAVRPDLVR